MIFFFLCSRPHLAVHQLRSDHLHRVLRDPPRDGRPHLQDPVPHAGQHRHVPAASRQNHVQRRIQQSHRVQRHVQAEAEQHNVRDGKKNLPTRPNILQF